MSASPGSGLRAVLASGGAGLLFVLSWLVVGVPLVGSLVVGAAAYAGLWLVLKRDGAEEKAYVPYVDKALAASTAAKARSSAAELRGLVETKGRGHPESAAFRRIADLLDAIAADVEEDPKDAPSANAFISVNSETAIRIAGLAFDLEGRGASAELKSQARDRLAANLERLEAAFRTQLSRLQEDNLAELQAELDVLEQSLGIEDEVGAGELRSGRVQTDEGTGKPKGRTAGSGG